MVHGTGGIDANCSRALLLSPIRKSPSVSSPFGIVIHKMPHAASRQRASK